MAFVNYKNTNNAQGQLQAGISASATTWILQAGQGALFPSTFPFFVKSEQYDTALNGYRVLKREIAKVTNRVWDTLTVVRSSGTCPPDYATLTPGTTSFSFNAGDTITHVITAEQIKDIQDTLATAVQVTDLQNNAAIFATATGSANAYVLTLSPAPTAYVNGQLFQFKANFTNTGSATLNINGLGAKIINKIGNTLPLGAGDIQSGQIVEVSYDGTNFQMQTPLGQLPTVDINGQTEVLTPNIDNDYALVYNATAGANRKVKLRKFTSLGWTWADWAIDGTADITITWSNNTVIVKNYSSFAAGNGGTQAYTNDPAAGSSIVLNMASTALFAVNDWVWVSSSAGAEAAKVTAVSANVSITVDTLALNHTTTNPLVKRMRKFTVTPTNCIVYIKVSGVADLQGWVFDFQGKGGPGAGGNNNAAGNNGTHGISTIGVVGGGVGGAVTQTYPYGYPPAYYDLSLAMKNEVLYAGCGSGAGSWGTSGGGVVGGQGGNGGGCIVFEIQGDLNLSSTAFDMTGTVGGWVGWGGNGGGGGGGFAGLLYGGTLTGAANQTRVSWGLAGTGGANGSGSQGGSSVLTQGSFGSGGSAGAGAVGKYMTQRVIM